MPIIVDVKGYGEVEFPDSMSDADMEAALKKGPWNQSPSYTPGGYTQPGPLKVANYPIQPPTGTGMQGEPIGAADSSFVQATEGKGLQYAGRALDVAGKVLYGGLVDEMENLFLPGEHRRQQQLETQLPGYEEPMTNIESIGYDIAHGEVPRELPAYSQLQNLSPFDQFIGEMGRGTVEAAPRLALAAATAPILGPYGSGALAFGLSDEPGGVNLKQAAIGALIPFAGRWMGEGAALLAGELGAEWQARNAVRAYASMAGPGLGLLGEQLYTIESQLKEGIITPEEAKRAKLNAWSSAAGMASFGPMHPKYEGAPNRPPIIPQRAPGAAKLSPIAGYEGLTQLEQAHLNKARETVTQPIVVKTEQPKTYTLTPESEQPFARKGKTSKGPGEYVLRANRATGEIEIYQGALQRWLLSVPEHQRERAMQTALGEEVIHHSITRNMAMELWDSMGPVSRAITAKLYTGRFSGIGADGKPVSVADLADEAARIRMQMLSRLGPREVAEAAFKDKWTMQSLVAIQHMINFATEGISGGVGSRRDIVRRMQDNLQAARSTVELGKVPDGLFMQRKEQGELPLEGRVAAALSMAKSDDQNKVPDQDVKFWSKPTGERTANASEVSQAAEVHGNLQPQPGQGHEEVPVQKGGEGVQPQAEGRVLEQPVRLVSESGGRKGHEILVTKDPASGLWRATYWQPMEEGGPHQPFSHREYRTKDEAIRSAKGEQGIPLPNQKPGMLGAPMPIGTSDFTEAKWGTGPLSESPGMRRKPADWTSVSDLTERYFQEHPTREGFGLLVKRRLEEEARTPEGQDVNYRLEPEDYPEVNESIESYIKHIGGPEFKFAESLPEGRTQKFFDMKRDVVEEIAAMADDQRMIHQTGDAQFRGLDRSDLHTDWFAQAYPTVHKLLKNDPEGLAEFMDRELSHHFGNPKLTFARDRLMDLGLQSDEANDILRDWSGGGRSKAIALDKDLAQWIDDVGRKGQAWDVPIPKKGPPRTKIPRTLFGYNFETKYRHQMPPDFAKDLNDVEKNGPGMIRKNQRDFMDDAETFAHEFKVADPEVFMRQLGRHLAGEKTKSDEQQKLFDEFAARHPEYDKFFNAPGMMRKNVQEETDVAKLQRAVGIYNRGIEDAKKQGDDRGVQTLTENRQEILDRLDQLAGERGEQSFPAMRRKPADWTGVKDIQERFDQEYPRYNHPHEADAPLREIATMDWDAKPERGQRHPNDTTELNNKAEHIDGFVDSIRQEISNIQYEQESELRSGSGRRFDVTDFKRADMKDAFPMVSKYLKEYPEQMGEVLNASLGHKSAETKIFARDRLMDLGLQSDEANEILKDWASEGRRRTITLDRDLAEWIESAVFGRSFFDKVNDKWQMVVPEGFARDLKSIEEHGPGMRRKPKPGELQTGLDFEGRTGTPPPPEPTLQQTGASWRSMTPEIMGQTVAEHIQKARDPSFEGFVKMATERWNVTRGQLVPAFREHYINALNSAKGDELKSLLYRMNLGRQEKIKFGTSMMEVNHPSGGVRSGKAVGDVADNFSEPLDMQFVLGGPKGTQAVVAGRLRFALQRAKNAKAREDEYYRMLAEAKAKRAELKALGFSDVNEQGKLVKAETPLIGPSKPATVNEQSLGLAKELFALRDRMDYLQDPQRESRKETRKTVRKRRGVMLENPELGGESQATVRAPGVTLLEEGEVKPVEDETARPGFQAGLPTPVRKMSKETRAKEDRRLRILSALIPAFEEQLHTAPSTLNRKTIAPEELALHKGPDVIRQIKPDEATEVGLVQAIATAAPEIDASTVVHKVIGGEKVSTTREAPKEAETNNILVVRDVNGRIFALSVYKASDGTVRVMDPYSSSLKRAHVPLDKSFIYKFTPIYHMSLDEPVRNFIQEFKNRDQFRNEILVPTRGLLAEASTRQNLLEMSTPEQVALARSHIEDQMASKEISQEAYEEATKQLDQREAEIESATKASQHPSMYSLGAGMGQMAKALQGRFRAKGLPPERLVTGNEADALWDLTKSFHPGEASTPATPESFLELMNNAPTDVQAGTLSPQARLALIALQKIETQMTEANDVAGAVSREQIANALSNAAQGGPEMFKDILVRRFGKSEEPPQSLESLTGVKRGLEPNPVEPTIRTPEELRAGGFEHRMRPPAMGQFEHPTPANLPESGKMLPPEQRQALAEQQPQFTEPTTEEINQQLVKMGNLSPEEYKYWMGGWPKFKSLGDTPISIFDTPGMMRKLVKDSVDTVNWGLINPSGALIQWYSAWMSRRLRALGGATGNQLADIFDMVIDRTKRHEGELFSQFGDIALREVGAPGPAGTWLNKFNVVHPVLARNAAIGNVVSATEGWTPVSWTTRGFVAHPIPAYALRAVQALRVANLAAGHLIQTVIPGFLANGSFERHLTPFGYDVVTAGDGPLFHALVNGEAVANGVPYATVRDMYQKLKAELDDPMPDTGRLDNMNQEFKRLLPRAVTHVQVENSGLANGWRQVRHANAFSYLNATMKRAAHMTAFREQFPTGSIGRAVLEQFRKDLYADPTKGHGPFSGSGDSTNQRALRANFDSVVRALQGHPTDQYGTSRITGYEYLRPGAAASEAIRLANATVFNLAAKMVLTKQYIVQIPELLLGSAPSYLGMSNYWQGLTNHRQFYAELERMGAVNRVMYDWSMDPQAPIQSFFKIAGNALSKFTGQNLLNEWQEAAAAATAKVVSERIQSGNLTPWENRQLPNTFKEMGFQPDQINRMMQGDPEVLDMFQRRAAAFLTGGNKHIAEGSRVGANRMVNSIFRFQMYPMMKMNQLRQDWETFSTARTPEARSVALERMARSMFFNVAQGAATAVLGAVTSSTINANVKALDAKHHPFMFLLGSWFNAQSGPLYLLYSAVDRTGMAGVGEQISRMIFPFAVTSDVFDMLNGTGRYKYMDHHERGDEFMRSKLPGMQPVQMGLSYLGLSREDVDLRASRTAFYKWKGKYYPDVGGGTAGESTEADAKFRTHMSQAVKALIRGEDDAFLESVIKATGFKNAKSAAASLRGKKILKDANNRPMDPDAIEALREEIGEKAYGKLEAYDLMLESAAQGIYPSKR